MTIQELTAELLDKARQAEKHGGTYGLRRYAFDMSVDGVLQKKHQIIKMKDVLRTATMEEQEKELKEWFSRFMDENPGSVVVTIRKPWGERYLIEKSVALNRNPGEELQQKASRTNYHEAPELNPEPAEGEGKVAAGSQLMGPTAPQRDNSKDVENALLNYEVTDLRPLKREVADQKKTIDRYEKKEWQWEQREKEFQRQLKEKDEEIEEIRQKKGLVEQIKQFKDPEALAGFAGLMGVVKQNMPSPKGQLSGPMAVNTKKVLTYLQQHGDQEAEFWWSVIQLSETNEAFAEAMKSILTQYSPDYANDEQQSA